MTTKARGEITLVSIVDVSSVTRYYRLQSSTSATPSKPTANPPSGWLSNEPAYTSGSTNSLYFVDLTEFSDGSYIYSNVSLSTSYEAAKEAYNMAKDARDAANGKNKVYRQPLAPPGTSYTEGDIWFDTDDGNLTYIWDGSKWEAQPFSSSAIGNLDAGKITTGTINADRIDAESLFSKEITVEGLLKSDDFEEYTNGHIFAKKGMALDFGYKTFKTPSFCIDNDGNMHANAGHIGNWVIEDGALHGYAGFRNHNQDIVQADMQLVAGLLESGDFSPPGLVIRGVPINSSDISHIVRMDIGGGSVLGNGTTIFDWVKLAAIDNSTGDYNESEYARQLMREPFEFDTTNEAYIKLQSRPPKIHMCAASGITLNNDTTVNGHVTATGSLVAGQNVVIPNDGSVYIYDVNNVARRMLTITSENAATVGHSALPLSVYGSGITLANATTISGCVTVTGDVNSSGTVRGKNYIVENEANDGRIMIRDTGSVARQVMWINSNNRFNLGSDNTAIETIIRGGGGITLAGATTISGNLSNTGTISAGSSVNATTGVAAGNGHGLYVKNASGSLVKLFWLTGGNVCTVGSNDYATSILGKTITASKTITVSSDRRLKRDITVLDGRHQALFDRLRPVSYRLREDEDGKEHIGLVAQDVQEALEQSSLTNSALVQADSEGMLSIGYGELIGLLIDEVQTLKSRLDTQETLMEQLTRRLDALKRRE